MASTDLITLDDARAFLQKQSGQGATDEVLSDLISRASRVIQRHIELEVAPATTSTARSFDWDGTMRLSLAPYVARTVTAVSLDGESLDSSGWRLMPNPARDGVYYTLHFDYTAVPVTTSYFPTRTASVTGTWGFSEVPEELKQATCETVAAWYRGRVAGFTAQFEDSGEQATGRGPEALPLGAYRILEAWRRSPV